MEGIEARDPVQDWLDRLVAALRRRTGNRLAEAEIKAGVKPGYLRKAQSASGNVMMRRFLHICSAADIEPGEIFAEVFPKTDYDPDLGMTVPDGPTPWIVKQARLRLDEPPRFPFVNEAWLEGLDELRYNDPKRAARTAERAVRAVCIEHLPTLLGIWASSCRLSARYNDGFSAMREALRLAREQKDRLVEADLLRRGASLVVSATANYAAALKIVDHAASLYARSGNFDCLGRCLVSQGLFLMYLGRPEEAEKAFKTALALLSDDSRRDRIAAFQLSGLIAQNRGQPQEALRFASKALPLATTQYEIGKIQWLVGSASAELRDWLRAHEAFEAACQCLLVAAPIDAALSACDHVRLLLAHGRLNDARLRISAMRRLMEPLTGNLIASAAVRDLVRSEREGKRLNHLLVQRIVRRIEESRRVDTRRL